MRTATNNKIAATTIEGPDGVSYISDEYKPAITDTTPITVAPTAIISGVVANLLAVAAGITNNATMRRTPTILIATAIIAATRIPKRNLALFGRSDSTVAKS